LLQTNKNWTKLRHYYTATCLNFFIDDIRGSTLIFTNIVFNISSYHVTEMTTGSALLENNEAAAKLTTEMAERLRRAQPDSVANHVTARSISNWRALT